MQIKRPKRIINGVLLLDKPVGFSSNQALQRVKHLFKAAKAGHTGNLDPFATGLLPVCLGEATKFSHTLLDADKTYHAVLKLGVTTSTGDTEGVVLLRKEVCITSVDVENAMSQFRGTITQIPPMHSALKHQGRPLYEYARAGVVIDRKPREVRIHALEVKRFERDEVEISVACSKGTYIRVLAEDIGSQLGCGAHLIALRRISTAGFQLQHAYTLEELESMMDEQRDQCLLPVDVLVGDLPAVELDEGGAHYFRQGQPVWKSGAGEGKLRVYGPAMVFLGVAESMGDGRIAPKRLIVQADRPGR